MGRIIEENSDHLISAPYPPSITSAFTHKSVSKTEKNQWNEKGLVYDSFHPTTPLF